MFVTLLSVHQSYICHFTIAPQTLSTGKTEKFISFLQLLLTNHTAIRGGG